MFQDKTKTLKMHSFMLFVYLVNINNGKCFVCDSFQISVCFINCSTVKNVSKVSAMWSHQNKGELGPEGLQVQTKSPVTFTQTLAQI